MARKINKCDFSYFCAIAAPEAPPERFRTLCDWGNWVCTTNCQWYFFVSHAGTVVEPLADLLGRSSHLTTVSKAFQRLQRFMLRICPVSVFDNGRLRDLPEESRLVMESLMMPLLGQNSQDEKRLHIVRAHDSVVERVLSVRDLFVMTARCDRGAPC